MQTVIDAIEQKQKPVFLKFGATWCGPCKMMKPIVDKVVKDFESAISYFDIDIDDNPELCEKFKVVSVPTMVLLSGENSHTVSGAMPEKSLRDFISKVL